VGESPPPPPLSPGKLSTKKSPERRKRKPPTAQIVRKFTGGRGHDGRFIGARISDGRGVEGLAIIAEANARRWSSRSGGRGHALGNLLLQRILPRKNRLAIGTSVDPVMIEIVNHLYMSIARADGACPEETPLLGQQGAAGFLLARCSSAGEPHSPTRPHMPVHLGSMGEPSKTVIRLKRREDDARRRVHAERAYKAGRICPTSTVITPVFGSSKEILFDVGSRGHHGHRRTSRRLECRPARRSSRKNACDPTTSCWSRTAVFDRRRPRRCSAGPAIRRATSRQNIATWSAVAAKEKGAGSSAGMVEHSAGRRSRYMATCRDKRRGVGAPRAGGVNEGRSSCARQWALSLKVKISITKGRKTGRRSIHRHSAQCRNTSMSPPPSRWPPCSTSSGRWFDRDIRSNGRVPEALEVLDPAGPACDAGLTRRRSCGKRETSKCVNDASTARRVMAAVAGHHEQFPFGQRAASSTTRKGEGGSGDGRGSTGGRGAEQQTTRGLTDPRCSNGAFPVAAPRDSDRRAREAVGAGEEETGNAAPPVSSSQ